MGTARGAAGRTPRRRSSGPGLGEVLVAVGVVDRLLRVAARQALAGARAVGVVRGAGDDGEVAHLVDQRAGLGVDARGSARSRRRCTGGSCRAGSSRRRRRRCPCSRSRTRPSWWRRRCGCWCSGSGPSSSATRGRRRTRSCRPRRSGGWRAGHVVQVVARLERDRLGVAEGRRQGALAGAGAAHEAGGEGLVEDARGPLFLELGDLLQQPAPPVALDAEEERRSTRPQPGRRPEIRVPAPRRASWTAPGSGSCTRPSGTGRSSADRSTSADTEPPAGMRT